MTTATNGQITRALRRGAVRATMAPSVHNTQPWRFVIRGSALEIHADHSRQLHVLDPRGRQLMLSCGCALLNARASIAASGFGVDVDRFPDRARPELVARITVNDRKPVEADLVPLDDVIENRRTNRRRFLDEPVSEEAIDMLVEAANHEGTDVVVVRRPEHRVAVATLSQRADDIENSDPGYRAELRAWTSDDPDRGDGVPANAVPHVDAGAQDDIPIRDFDTRGKGRLPTLTQSSMNQCLLLVGALEETSMAWLRTGEGLERMLLEITRHEFAASPLTQVIEVASTNAMLRDQLGLLMHPHVLLRVGRAPATPKVRRRRLVDVLSESA